MPTFLEKLSKHIYSSYKDDLGEICIVLPNRRAALFIRKYLAKIIEKTSFLPEFYSIEDFVVKCSGQNLADQMSIQFRLYELHKKIAGKDARSIEEFLPYASWMYSDFNEIDMYLVDYKQLFGYLSDVKAMNKWNPDGRPLSDFEKRYLAFFRSLEEYYLGLNEMLSAENLTYQGKAFRIMAENIQTLSEEWKWKKVIFAGFNALTKAEVEIISNLWMEKKAEVFWDADKYYTENKEQEAGKFLREYFKSIQQGEILWEEDNFADNKDIEVIGVPKNAGQVKYAGEILQKLFDKNGTLDNTAVVLSDESLLLPLLNSIPEAAGEFNVTMGLALRNTPLFSLMDNLLLLHLNADRFSKIGAHSERVFYGKDLIKIFGHPWMISLEKSDPSTQKETITALIKESGKVFMSIGDVYAIVGEYFNPEIQLNELFSEKKDSGSMLTSFVNLLAALRKSMIESREEKTDEKSIELEYIFRFTQLVQKLDDLESRFDSLQSLKTLHLIFRQLAAQIKIPFYGEPLQGLQLMGMLETRTLDFDTVILLSVNEGMLPSGRMVNSFVPFDIKHDLGLPTYLHNTAVFAYHFYRLLQRTKKAYLLYNTESDQLGGGEKSQFITQMLHELPKYNKNIQIREKLLTMPAQRGLRDTSISISKNESVMQLLREEAAKGFHPSSLNIYINCPLQFYLSRLMKVREVDEAEETIDSKLLGIVVHEALETLLTKYVEKPLTKDIYKKLGAESKDEIRRQFKKHMSDADLRHGKNYLIVNVAVGMLKQLFKRESEWLEEKDSLVIDHLEKSLETVLDDFPELADEDIRFRGTIDRIDTWNNECRVLDYKTGFVAPKQLSFKTWEELISDPEKSKAFQLMVYAWVYSRQDKAVKEMIAGIISLRAPGNGAVLLKSPEGELINASSLKAFGVQLKLLVKEIFDTNTPFTQTEDEDRCRYCDFREMCNRNNAKDFFS